MKTLVNKINALLPYFSVKTSSGAQINKTSLGAFTLRAAIMESSSDELDKNRLVFIKFYQRAYDYFARIYDKDNSELLIIIKEGFKLDYLTFFKVAVARQIELTAEIKQNIATYTPEQQQLYYHAFFENFYFIQLNSRNLPAHFNAFTQNQIQTYIALYLEYLSDHGWTVRFPEFNLPLGEMKECDEGKFKPDSRNPANADMSFLVSREEAETDNFKEYKRYFKEISQHSRTDNISILSRAFEDLLTFCNTIGFSGNEQKSENIEQLIEAIKQDDVAIIRNIVITDTTIISRLCPDTFVADEIGFTPLIMAAKYCKNADTLEQGLFCAMKNKADRLRYLSSKTSNPCKPINSYNSLLVAARWGTPAVFKYIFSLVHGERIKPENRSAMLTILECICLPHLGYSEFHNVTMRQQQIKSRNEFLNTLADSLLAGQSDLTTLFGGVFIHSDIQRKLAVFKPESPSLHFFQGPVITACHPEHESEPSATLSIPIAKKQKRAG
jgi:hypothetical protein